MIRKFSNNTSEMKKLAACDFEDILQVQVQFCEFYIMLANIPTSVLFRFSKGCFLLTTMQLSSLFSINLRNGTHSQNSGYTATPPWFFLTKPSRNSLEICGSFGFTLALPSTRRSYQRRKQNGWQNAPKLVTLLQNQVRPGGRSSI